MNKLLLLLLFAMAALLSIKLSPIFRSEPPQPHLRYNDVRGIAVEQDGLLYTLNFEEQKEMINQINQGIKTKSNIIIYRFDED